MTDPSNAELQPSASGSALLSEFDAVRPTYEGFTANLRRLLETLISSSLIEVLSYEERTKSRDSFSTKIARSDKAGKYDRFCDVTDISGVRVVCYNKEDVSRVTNLVRENFLVDELNTIDKSTDIESDRFGYLSVHLIVSHNEQRAKLLENKAFSGLKAEIQVRTVLQHAWAVLDRKLRYNSPHEMPREIKRKLFRVSALLETADDVFSEIESKISILQKEYTSAIEQGYLDQDINLDTLIAFLAAAPSANTLMERARVFWPVKSIERTDLSDPDSLRSVSNLLQAIKVSEVKTVKDLDSLICIANNSKIDLIKEISVGSKGDKFTSAGVVRLALVLTVSNSAATNILLHAPFFGDLQIKVASAIGLDWAAYVQSELAKRVSVAVARVSLSRTAKKGRRT